MLDTVVPVKGSISFPDKDLVDSCDQPMATGGEMLFGPVAFASLVGVPMGMVPHRQGS